jgi:hypothetical protein
MTDPEKNRAARNRVLLARMGATPTKAQILAALDLEIADAIGLAVAGGRPRSGRQRAQLRRCGAGPPTRQRWPVRFADDDRAKYTQTRQSLAIRPPPRPHLVSADEHKRTITSPYFC